MGMKQKYLHSISDKLVYLLGLAFQLCMKDISHSWEHSSQDIT